MVTKRGQYLWLSDDVSGKKISAELLVCNKMINEIEQAIHASRNARVTEK